MFMLRQEVQIKSSGHVGVIIEIEDRLGLNGECSTRYKVRFPSILLPFFLGSVLEEWCDADELAPVIASVPAPM